MSFDNEDTEKSGKEMKIALVIGIMCIVVSGIVAVIIYGGFI